MTQFLNTLANLGVSVGIRLLGIIAVLIIGMKLSDFVAKKFEGTKRAQELDPTVRNLLGNLIRWSIRVVMGVIICGMLNIPTASVIAVLSSVGLAVGLALQGGLSNIAGGIMIVFTRPFRVGDCIETGGYLGTVTNIGLFYTTILTLGNSDVVLPNGSLMNATVVNHSREEKRRVLLDFSVAYGSDIELVHKVLLASATNHSLVLQDPAPDVLLVEHGTSALKFRVRAWTMNADYWTVYFDLLEDVKRAFDQFNIEIPYNQLDVHVVEKK